MKKSDLQVYFHDLQKRYDNMDTDPDVQRVDYQIMAHNALTVLERTIDEGLDDDQTRLEAYHSGYDQGRFDEFADRMGKEQAEKVKGELEQQKNCPYCHTDKNGEVKLIINHEHYEDYLNESDSLDASVYNGKLFCDVYVARDPFDDGYLDAEFDCKSPINYCPMCGRPLNGDTDQ